MSHPVITKMYSVSGSLVEGTCLHDKGGQILRNGFNGNQFLK